MENWTWKRWALIAAVPLVLLWAFFAFHRITTDPGNETALVDTPFFGGAGGVRDTTQKPGTGWYWFTTSGWNYSVTPIKIDEPLDHLPTADNNFINYASYIVLQFTDIADNVRKFGPERWYEHNLKEPYRTIVRDVSKQYNMTAIMTDPNTLAAIEKDIAARFTAHIKQTGLHVNLITVQMGKALPDAAVIVEMNNTAVQQQRKKSEVQRKLAEDSRLEAERARAAADNAYRNSMGLNPEEFVRLEGIKRYSEACAKSSCTIIQGSVPIVVGK